MEARKTIVNELNELAYKMTGVNPKATTDAGALNYIEQNYQGGGSGGSDTIYLEIPDSVWQKIYDNGRMATDITSSATGDDLIYYNRVMELDNDEISSKNVRIKVGPYNAIASVYHDEYGTGLYASTEFDTSENFYYVLTISTIPSQNMVRAMYYNG